MHTEEQTETSVFKATSALRYTSVEEQSSYSELFLGGIYDVSGVLQLGVQVPFVSTSVASTRATGLGNVVPFINVSLLPSPTEWTLAAGLQLELPTVTSEALGDGHFLILPTLQGGWHPGSGILMTTIGLGQVLDNNHTHGPSESHTTETHDHHEHAHEDDSSNHHDNQAIPSIVNPHASSELLVRTDIGYRWTFSDTHLRVTLRLDGIENLTTGGETTVIQSGPVIGLNQSKLSTEVYMLAPVTEAQRYRLRAGIRVRLSIP